MIHFNFYALLEYKSFEIEEVLPMLLPGVTATVFEAIDPKSNGNTLLLTLKIDPPFKLNTFKEHLLNYQNNIYLKKVNPNAANEILLSRFQIYLDKFLYPSANEDNHYDLILKEISSIQLSNIDFKKDFILIDCKPAFLLNAIEL